MELKNVISEDNIENKWIPYTGEYEKKYYDIQDKYGNIYEHCYPNAGRFHDQETGMVIHGDRIVKFKICERQFEL